jgi:lipoate-protein ligase A
VTEKWRFLDTGAHDAFYNMALDEAITTARAKNMVPNTVRFYRWTPSAVSIGYFQSLEDEVNVAECDSKGVHYVRRRTGGGAVYHDEYGELTYSITLSEKHKLVSSDIQRTYESLCSGLIEGFKFLKIPAKFKPINDVLVDSKKISGNAQTRNMGVVLQHGTILVEVNPTVMFNLLKVPSEKIRDKLIKNVEERVTSVNSYLARKVEFSELKEAFRKGLEKTFSIRLVLGRTIDFEEKLAEKLRTEKYASNRWNFKR